MRPTMEAMSVWAHGDKYVFIDTNSTDPIIGDNFDMGFMQVRGSIRLNQPLS